MARAELRSEQDALRVLAEAGRLAETSRETAACSSERFRRWCEANQLPHLPTDEQTLLRFVHAHYGRWRPATIRSAGSGIAQVQLAAGWPDPRGERWKRYIALTKRDATLAAPERLVDAIRIQEAKTIVADRRPSTEAPATAIAARLRALLSVAYRAPVPRSGESETWRSLAELPAALPRSAFTVTGDSIDVRLPGGGRIRLSRHAHAGECHAVERVLAADASEEPLAWAGQADHHPGLLATAGRCWRRAGFSEVFSLAALRGLSGADFAWLLLHADRDVGHDRRNLAYLLLGVTLARRHSELRRMLLDDVQTTSFGYRVGARTTKTHQEDGEVWAVPHTDEAPGDRCVSLACPACALREHVEVLHRCERRTSGPLFATVYAGRLRHMTRQNGRLILRNLWQRAGLPDDARISTRGLRAGGATTASEMGMTLWEIAKITGHRDLRTCQIYIRRYDPFRLQFFLSAAAD